MACQLWKTHGSGLSTWIGGLTLCGLVAFQSSTGEPASAAAPTQSAPAADSSSRHGRANDSGQPTTGLSDLGSSDSVVSSTGALTIQTTPESAKVIIDGNPHGVTPVTVSGLTPGEHALELRKTAYYMKKARVDVSAESITVYTFELLAPARLVVISDPAGAAVSLNGKQVGTTPYDNAKVKPGDYTVEAALQGHLLQQTKVSLGSAESDTLSLRLVKAGKETVAAPESPAKPKSMVARIIVLSVFVLFGIGILIAELAGP